MSSLAEPRAPAVRAAVHSARQETLRFLVVLRATWSLNAGIAILMLGHGLQGTLLSVRATLEGFPTAITGVVMSGYYAGLLLGSFIAPRLVARVGHVRTFAAMLAVSSTSILFHALLVEPVAWFVLRLLTGFCLSGAFICAESWLNGAASNHNRGRLLSVYMVVQLGAYALGQYLLALADPRGSSLFILASVLLSLASVPMLLTVTFAPVVHPALRPMRLGELYAISPLGVVGLLGVGLAQSALYAMGPVFAQGQGLSLAATATFMACIIGGGVVFQWPVGLLSDRLDRRGVVAGVALAAALALLPALGGTASPALLFAQFFVVGGLALPLYALCTAHVNDLLAPRQVVGASSTILLAYGLGASFGPTLASVLMAAAGPLGFVVFVVAVHAFVGGFALYRSTRRPGVPAGDRRSLVAQPSPTPMTQRLVGEARASAPAEG